ncbi:Mbeg1-like protein [Pseudomonas sp. CGJS7]|uniref:Mbeg1-like protein n=1 Tax=Pseudomonas sp. CGJS7 TaxID=3109348 RepID=UPI00300AC5C0
MNVQLQPTQLQPNWQTQPEVLPPAAQPVVVPPPVDTSPYTLDASYHPQLLGVTARPGPAANAAPDPTSFDQQLRGKDSQPIDLQMAEISQAVYNPDTKTVGNWTRLDDAQLTQAGIDPKSLENSDTGFRAGIYSDGNGKYVVAYAGSNDVQDWITNARQGIGWDAKQYDQAVQLAKDAQEAFGENMVITGHSLGGGLAATAALATDTAAVTFNASGVHDDTLRDLGLDPGTVKDDAANGQIRRYNIGGEILTAAQEDVPVLNKIPDAPGHEINLDDPDPPKAPDFTWNPIEMAKRTAEYVADKVKRPGELHAIAPVIDAMKQQQPWN